MVKSETDFLHTEKEILEKQIRDIIDEQSPNGEINVDYALATFVEAECKAAYALGKKDGLAEANFAAEEAAVKRIRHEAQIEILLEILPEAKECYKEYSTSRICADMNERIYEKVCKKIIELKGAEL
jgi:hypothetical protein